MPPDQTKTLEAPKQEMATQTPAPIQPKPTCVVTQQPSLTKLPPNDIYRKLLPAALFLLTFVSVMTLLLMYMDSTAMRAQQFRVNMTKDYEMRIAQDNQDFIKYIRQRHLGSRIHRHHYVDESLVNDALESDREKIRLIGDLSGNKANGSFMELLIGGGRDPVTTNLQLKKGWRGLVVRADPEDALMLQDYDTPGVNTLHACLSPIPHPKEVTYYESLREWNEDGVSVNSLESFDTRAFNSRVMCYPLYTLMLVVNETNCDYVIISSPGDQLAVLETVPWDMVNIKILEVRIPKGPSRVGTTKFLQSKNYVLRAQVDDAVIYIKPSPKNVM